MSILGLGIAIGILLLLTVQMVILQHRFNRDTKVKKSAIEEHINTLREKHTYVRAFVPKAGEYTKIADAALLPDTVITLQVSVTGLDVPITVPFFEVRLDSTGTSAEIFSLAGLEANPELRRYLFRMAAIEFTEILKESASKNNTDLINVHAVEKILDKYQFVKDLKNE